MDGATGYESAVYYLVTKYSISHLPFKLIVLKHLNELNEKTTLDQLN